MLEFYVSEVFHTPEGPIVHQREKGTGSARLVLHLPNGYKVPDVGLSFALDSSFDHLHVAQPKDERIDELEKSLGDSGDIIRGLRLRLDTATIEIEGLKKAAADTPPAPPAQPDDNVPELLTDEQIAAFSLGDPHAPAPSSSA